MSFKSGFISIIGRPNAGKSTLLNFILGEKLSIISSKPQTTRNVIRAVHNSDSCQMVFLDTPGIHEHKGLLNEYMVKEALSQIKDVDVILYIIDSSAGITREDKFIISELKKAKPPVVVAVNKIDSGTKETLLPIIDKLSKEYGFSEVYPLSAKKGDGVGELLNFIESKLPEGPKYFPDDEITDRPERFVASEMIREKVFNNTSDEVPYSVAITIDEFKDREKVVAIKASINVDRDSQKGIIIGKKGSMLKKIGTEARLDLENFLGCKVYLELFVRVQKNWTKSTKGLKDFGYE